MYSESSASVPSPIRGLTIRQELVNGEWWLRLDGAFNRATALELHRELELLDQLQIPRIVLDFSKVDEFHELGIPSLTRGLESRNVRVVGLPNRCMRVFECFGWSAKNRAGSRKSVIHRGAVEE